MLVLLALLTSARADDAPGLRGPDAHATFGLSHGWGSWKGEYTGAGRATGLGFEGRLSILGLAHREDDGVFVQDYLEADFGAGGDRSTGPDGDDVMWFRYRLGLGAAVVLQSDDLDAWLRLGPYAGADTVTGEMWNGFGYQKGWATGLGARLGPVTLDLGVPVGARDRLMSARLFVAPNGRFGAGLSYEHVLERDGLDRFAENELMLHVGLR